MKTIGTYAVTECQNLKSDITIPDSVEIIDSYAFFACQSITGIIFNDSSNLKTLSTGCFQLLARAKYAIFPSSLSTIGDIVLSSCNDLGEIKFLGMEAPSITNSTFGTDSISWTGRTANNRIIFVPTNSYGYEEGLWANIFDEDREVYFTLSKTL